MAKKANKKKSVTAKPAVKKSAAKSAAKKVAPEKENKKADEEELAMRKVMKGEVEPLFRKIIEVCDKYKKHDLGCTLFMTTRTGMAAMQHHVNLLGASAIEAKAEQMTKELFVDAMMYGQKKKK